MRSLTNGHIVALTVICVLVLSLLQLVPNGSVQNHVLTSSESANSDQDPAVSVISQNDVINQNDVTVTVASQSEPTTENAVTDKNKYRDLNKTDTKVVLDWTGFFWGRPLAPGYMEGTD